MAAAVHKEKCIDLLTNNSSAVQRRFAFEEILKVTRTYTSSYTLVRRTSCAKRVESTGLWRRVTRLYSKTAVFQKAARKETGLSCDLQSAALPSRAMAGGAAP